MPAIGDRTVNLFTVDRDETVYTGPTHSVSHTDTVALRRTLPASPEKALRTNMRFERGVSVPGASPAMEKPVTVSIAVTVAPGVDEATAKTFIKDTLVQASDVADDLAISGDIHL